MRRCICSLYTHKGSSLCSKQAGRHRGTRECGTANLCEDFSRVRQQANTWAFFARLAVCSDEQLLPLKSCFLQTVGLVGTITPHTGRQCWSLPTWRPTHNRALLTPVPAAALHRPSCSVYGLESRKAGGLNVLPSVRNLGIQLYYDVLDLVGFARLQAQSKTNTIYWTCRSEVSKLRPMILFDIQ